MVDQAVNEAMTDDEEQVYISFRIPAWVVVRQNMTPESFAEWVQTSAALYRHSRGEITLGTAAALAGTSQAAFIHALKDAGHETFAFDLDDFGAELTHLATLRPPGVGDG